MNKLFKGIIAFAIVLCACSGENGVDGQNGKDAEVNIDSLANVIREEITGSLWDTLYAKPYIDTVYNALFDNTFASKWMDSVRNALLDSLRDADYEDLYTKLYDSVYSDIYSQTTIRSLDGFIYYAKENIYGSFANQYPLMYKTFKSGKDSNFVPLSVSVRNQCLKSTKNAAPCNYKKIMVQAWIPGFTDTASVTSFVNPDTSAKFSPKFKFDNKALAKLTSSEKAQYEIRAYALENDHQILFFNGSSPVTIHPMQVFGAELEGVKNINWWYSVWVTPNADSISHILTEISRTLPDTTLKVYQKYTADTSIAQSSRRVVSALFSVLQKRKIKYVQNESLGSVGQKIQYPVETLRKKQGICIETSILFASILEAMGFQAVLVIIPGHSFVGWHSEKDSKVYDFIETTMISNSKATAADAINSAIKTYNAEVEAKNFSTGKSEIVDLATVRKYGILPNDVP